MVHRVDKLLLDIRISCEEIIEFCASKEAVNSYTKLSSLPLHSLWNEGYGSIGCLPCTPKGVLRKVDGLVTQRQRVVFILTKNK